jgi:hypothetical protein
VPHAVAEVWHPSPGVVADIIVRGHQLDCYWKGDVKDQGKNIFDCETISMRKLCVGVGRLKTFIVCLFLSDPPGNRKIQVPNIGHRCMCTDRDIMLTSAPISTSYAY